MNLQENIQRIKEVMGIQSEEKESGEKWIKCINCKKKFTQTIHKGKKSLPICPRCGTHNDMMSDSDVKQEQTESELTERCWKGYTQKGMKTMFGKRYPNCVKKKKK
jgi:acetyl-CoA carboxylase beta subunit